MTDAAGSYVCEACGWVYDPALGDPDGGIAPGTPWDEIPDDWMCPVCGAGKDAFAPVGAGHAAPAPAPHPAGRPLVIVGSGLAGYGLARELRRRDPKLALVIVTADGGEVYTKPMLSTALARHQEPDDLVQKGAADLARELDLEIRTRTRVLAIDRTDRHLTLEDAKGPGTLAYGRLVLALGADPRVFPAPGSESVPIATVNDLDDYRLWRGRIGAGGPVLLIGAGLIGCEFANDLAAAGHPVALVDPAPWPLARLLPEALGSMLTQALKEAGATAYLGRSVARYLTVGDAWVAELSDGTRVPFDHALSAVGLAPRTRIAVEAGLKVGVGILTDRLLCTSDPAIFALGDCAETPAGPLPYVAPLLAQARALAATLTGEPTPLQLPALPVVVKTPVLPLVVCPPPPGSQGAWELELGGAGALAIFRTAEGTELGFALAGTRTTEQKALAKRMPDLLPPAQAQAVAESPPTSAGGRYVCATCAYVYDPVVGDPDGGIAPGTPWEAVPDDWVCPICGAGKAAFSTA